MPWVRARFKGREVWAEVDAKGELAVAGGRVPIRYSEREGARIYRAGASRVERTGKAPRTLPAGVAASSGPKRGTGRAGLGRAGSRTAAQEARAREAAAELLASFPAGTVVCFTDGACSGNPGPTGSGAVVRLPDGQVLERYAALGQATNNVGELTAIALALDLIDEADLPADVPVEILSDSRYAVNVLVHGWKARTNRELVAELKARLARRAARIHWVAGHAGIRENERADELARLGAEESRHRR